MLTQILSLSPRRLFAIGVLVAGVLLGILLIILWQVGLFDSAPPPVAIESAVESVTQEQQEQAEGSSQSAQAQAQQQTDETVAEDAQSEAVSSQEQQEGSAADPGSDAEPQTQSAEPQEAAATDDSQEQTNQDQASEQPQASEESEPQQTQEDVQQQSNEQVEQEVMTAETPELADLAGTWTLSTQGTSFVGYRIGEEIADIGTTTAVGRTGEIDVTLEFDGASIAAVTIVADLSTLRSDQSFRDRALRTRGIETDTYPFATFALSEPIPIDALPTGEETLVVTVQGTLDLHGVTNPVSIALEGQYVDGLVVIVGSTEIALADYDIEKPTTARVFSIDDVGIMEFQLVLERAP